VDKFIGDAIMGLWNAPQTVDGHAAKACRAALRIRDRMQGVARPDGRTAAPLVRVGIATGQAFVGNIGSQSRLSYTAIGDVVNIASRLEAMCKELGTEIAVSRPTALAAGPDFRFRPHGNRTVRGRDSTLEVLELLDIACPAADRDGLALQPGEEGLSDAAA
jgi:class 3 adenylate cyclase